MTHDRLCGIMLCLENWARYTQSISLSISNNVEDAIELSSPKPIKSGTVTGWHKTLENGFQAAFADSHRLISNGGDPELVLTIKRADPAFNMAIGGVRAQVTYSADLVAKNGAVMGRSARTVESKLTVAKADEARNAMQSAVETMFESIAEDVLKR